MNQVLWDVTSCRRVSSYRRFERSWCLHLQRQAVVNQLEPVHEGTKSLETWVSIFTLRHNGTSWNTWFFNWCLPDWMKTVILRFSVLVDTEAANSLKRLTFVHWWRREWQFWDASSRLPIPVTPHLLRQTEIHNCVHWCPKLVLISPSNIHTIYFIIFYIIHCRIAYAATFTEILL